MKRVFATTVCLCLMLLCGTQAKAQLSPTTHLEQWKYAFSEEGRQNWKPEFTARAYGGFYEAGVALSAGVRIDNRRTLGILVAKAEMGSASSDTEYFTKIMATYRRYYHIGKRERFAFYSDMNFGVGIVNKVELGPTAELEEYHSKPGDWGPMLEWQPGIRLRLIGNSHISLGPSLSPTHFGLHIGVGF